MEKNMEILPEGEQLRKAVRWISEKRTEDSRASLTRLIDEASLRFDLSPKDTEVLMHLFGVRGAEKSS
jgi:hypothetical protein